MIDAGLDRRRFFQQNATVSPTFLHQAFWCEENVWHLAQHPATAGEERLVLVLTGANAEVACWQQKASEDGGPILWDYHVVLATRAGGWQLWDLDTRLGCPVPAARWLAATFPWAALVPARFQPRFAVFTADAYVNGFRSDRSHMRAADGSWLQPPPPWPALDGAPLGHALRLHDIVAQARRGLDLARLTTRLR